jgi:hypothetical protein
MSELESELEGLIDRQSLGSVLAALVMICRAKADNGNTSNAVLWSLASSRLERVAASIRRMGV